MKILLLNESYSGDNKYYKGTHRISPNYCEEFSDKEEINQLFFWSCDTEPRGYLEDIVKSRRLIELYQRRITPEFFEIIEVTVKNENPIMATELIGYDISAEFSASLLSYGLDMDSIDHINDKILEIIKPLISLTQDYFKPKLNKNILFDDYETALFCLKCLLSLQSLHGNLFENGDLSYYEVVGIYKI